MTEDGAAAKSEAKKRKARKHPDRRAARAASPVAASSKPAAFPIVGIGASAGGLEAVGQFFTNMPSDSDAAFILVQHLDPDHASRLPDLLSRLTRMPVLSAEDGMQVQPNKVFVIPPGKTMTIKDGALLLLARTAGAAGVNTIDIFLRSLAMEAGENAVAIILSGTGRDGTQGTREIKAHLGLVMAQDPATARYEGMPQSAIGTGLVDFVLEADRMPGQLLRYWQASRPEKLPIPEAPSHSDGLRRILQSVHRQTGHDFSEYKPSTLLRRIERRMKVREAPDFEFYAQLVQQDPGEAEALFREFLINVTGFFRDPKAFDAFKERVKDILTLKPEGDRVRVWVVGCATGEEAYSVAIILRECMDELGREFSVQIFAADIDAEAVTIAREGRYPLSITQDVPPERLRKYFVKSEHGLTIKKQIREMLVFSVQSLIKDPPFMRMDIVTMRNVLIYLNNELQNRVIALVHYALNPGGLLFLGPSETAGDFSKLFVPLDRENRIYRRDGEARRAPPALLPAPASYPEVPPHRQTANGMEPNAGGHALNMETALRKALLDSAVPPSVVIDREGRIVYFHGETGRYFAPAPGSPTWSALDMAREGLRPILSAAIMQANTTGKPVTMDEVAVKYNGGALTISVTARPLAGPGLASGMLMVSFEERESGEARQAKGGKGKRPRKGTRAAQLEQELQRTREDLRTLVEELETSNEQLKAAVEEHQSVNEELQSANEELETSREELQSLNEELLTSNAELQARNEELSHLNDDLRNLFNATQVATIILDNQLRVQRYTPAANVIYNLMEGDVGRPIAHITSKLVDYDVVEDGTKVLDTLVPIQREVRTSDGKWHAVRIQPYRTMENAIGGVVVAMTDITAQKQLSDRIEQANKFADAIITSLHEPVVMLDAGLRVVSANEAFYSTFSLDRKATIGRLIYDVGDGGWNIPALRQLLEEKLPVTQRVEGTEFEYDFRSAGRRKLRLNARAVGDLSQDEAKVLMTISDLPSGAGG